MLILFTTLYASLCDFLWYRQMPKMTSFSICAKGTP